MKKHLKNGCVFALVIGIPLLYLYNLLIIYIGLNSLSLPTMIRVLGIVMASIGIVLWSISMATLKGKFGVLPHKHQKITHGVYKYLKHPMYVGIWLVFTGLSLAGQSFIGLVFTNIVMVPVLILRAYFEEKELQ